VDANLENGDPEQAGEFLSALQHKSDIEIAASPQVATSVAMVDGKVQVFLANFSGLRGGVNPVPAPLKDITIRLRTGAKRVEFLPFLGDVEEVRGRPEAQEFVYRLPIMTRGGVVSIEN
jgi:hypothetical protein